jgi:hypothetical protein
VTADLGIMLLLPGTTEYGTEKAVALWNRLQKADVCLACPKCQRKMNQTGGRKQLRLVCTGCKYKMGANEGGKWMQKLLDEEEGVGLCVKYTLWE